MEQRAARAKLGSPQLSFLLCLLPAILPPAVLPPAVLPPAISDWALLLRFDSIGSAGDFVNLPLCIAQLLAVLILRPRAFRKSPQLVDMSVRSLWGS